MLLSIVIPTYNEMDNVLITADSIQSQLGEIDYEIIFIDDSTDNTPVVLASLCKENSNLKYEHRTEEKGLGTAVVRGFQLAQADVIAVMDADLQHPPEMLIPMLNKIINGASIVIPSRFIPGGEDGGLRLHRKVVSAVARYLGKISLKALRNVSDPTSGFFMFKRNVIDDVTLKPIGWKILIEIICRGKVGVIDEIPYRFQPRHAGESKMSISEQLNYIRHLILLLKDSPNDRRFYLFAIIGSAGVIANMTTYSLLVKMSVAVPLAGTISAFIALCINFLLNDHFTWADSRKAAWHIRAGKYLVTSLIGICINIAVLGLAFHVFNIEYLISNLVGIILATLWNYTVNSKWVWRRESPSEVSVYENSQSEFDPHDALPDVLVEQQLRRQAD